MKTRYSQRVLVDCSVMFAGENIVGEGRMVDLSLPGCLLESSQTMIAGEYLQLRLFLPDHSTPLNVALAAVRWVDGCKLGVEFIRTSQQEQSRLTQFVNQQSGRIPSSQWSESVVLIGSSDK